MDSPLFAGESYSVNKIYYFQLFEKFTFLEQLFFLPYDGCPGTRAGVPLLTTGNSLKWRSVTSACNMMQRIPKNI